MNRSRYTDADAALSVVLRRFPGHTVQIRQLLDRDDSFRGMCDDLAIAEQTLAAVNDLPDALREKRRSEYAEMVAELVREIKDALDRGKIIRLRTPPHH